ncbi:MAG: helix-turn-helix domain-containing protein [Trichormus sp.]
MRQTISCVRLIFNKALAARTVVYHKYH